MTKLLINDLELWGYHGVFDFEKEAGQPYRISCVISLRTQSDINDVLEETVSYVDCLNVIKDTFTSSKHNLLEHVGHAICTQLFYLDNRITKVKLTILKTKPPVDDQVSSLGVTLCRRPSF